MGSKNPRPLHTIRISNSTNVNGFHCMRRCLPPFGSAQGRLFRKGREKWGTLCLPVSGLSKSKSESTSTAFTACRVTSHFSQRTRKMGHPLFGGVGCQSQNSRPLHTIRINNSTNVNGFHRMRPCLPLFAKDAKNGAPFVWWRRDG